MGEQKREPVGVEVAIAVPRDESPESIKSHRIDLLFSSEQISRRVLELGRAISLDYPSHDEPVLLVCVLKGAALFLADLVRAMDRPVEFDFVAVSSYGGATTSSGEVRVRKDLDAAVAG